MSAGQGALPSRGAELIRGRYIDRLLLKGQGLIPVQDVLGVGCPNRPVGVETAGSSVRWLCSAVIVSVSPGGEGGGDIPIRRCLFWSFSRCAACARCACSRAARRAAFLFCSCCQCSIARWGAGFSGRGAFGGTMSPSQTSRSLISLWKEKVIRAARNAMVAPTNAEVNSNARSNTSLFIG